MKQMLLMQLHQQKSQKQSRNSPTGEFIFKIHNPVQFRLNGIFFVTGISLCGSILVNFVLLSFSFSKRKEIISLVLHTIGKLLSKRIKFCRRRCSFFSVLLLTTLTPPPCVLQAGTSKPLLVIVQQ